MQAAVERACEFAETIALCGYDSLHLAAASVLLVVAPREVRFACFDNWLNKAAKVLGFDLPWPLSRVQSLPLTANRPSSSNHFRLDRTVNLP